MASPHQISTPGLPGPLNFEFWRGQPPPVIHEQVEVFTKPGADGTGEQKVGRHHPPIRALLVSHWNSYTAALAALSLYQAYPASGLVQVKYNAHNWSAFGIGFYVDAVEFVECKARILLIGPGYAYSGGAELVTEWTLTPIEVS